jgi:hypothetical protein
MRYIALVAFLTIGVNAASAGFISTDLQGTNPATVKWTIDTTDVGAIASLHITGGPSSPKVKTGPDGKDLISQPDGWTFSGDVNGGNYSWQADSNQSGTMLMFSITFDADITSGKFNFVPALSVSYDKKNDGSRTETEYPKPQTPSATNYGFALTAIPEPSGLVLASLGFLTLLCYTGSRKGVKPEGE